MASTVACVDISSSDWRKDWELSEDALWSAIKTTQFQRLLFKSKPPTGGLFSSAEEMLLESLPYEPIACTGLCGTDNYTRCPYCLVFQTKVGVHTDIFTLRDQMRERKALWECCCNFYSDTYGRDDYASKIWSFLVPSDLLFIPASFFHGDTFDYFLSQMQTRIETRNRLRIHQSLKEAPLKPVRAERFELNVHDEPTKRKRPRPIPTERNLSSMIGYCACCMDYDDYFYIPEEPPVSPTSHVLDNYGNITIDFYGKVMQTSRKKLRSGTDEEKRRRRKKSRQRSIQRSKNARLKRGMHTMRST